MATINGSSHPQDNDEYQTLLGGRLLPQVLDTWAAEDPNYIVGKMARSDSGSMPMEFEFVNLSVSQLANAVNYASHWLNQTLNTTPKDNAETIAFIGLQDHRYWVMYYACMKTGRRLLMPSRRNALSNNASLLNITKCKTLFYTGPPVSEVQTLQELVTDLQIFSLPSLENMTASTAEHYPYTKTWAEAKDDIVMIVHTSGSTANPKPIYYTNTYLQRIDCDILTPPVEGRQLANTELCKRGKNLLIGSNFFHLSGILASVSAVFRRFTVVCGPADRLASGEILAELVKIVPINGMMLVPSVCDSLFVDHGEEIKPHLSGTEHVCWLGGPLAHSTGKWITTHLSHIKLWQIFGSTELCLLPLLIPPHSHWQYIEFHPSIGPTLVPTADSELFEVVQRRHPDPRFAWTRPVFTIFPDLEEFGSRDLLRRCPDPGFENLWMFESRVDDLMLLSNGSKVNPVHMETKLQVHPLLKGTLVFGNGHTFCGLLLEPKDDIIRGDELVEKVWGAVEEVNGLVPSNARVSKGMVIVADSGRPFVRAAKGTVVRKLTLGLYEKEIEEVYHH